MCCLVCLGPTGSFVSGAFSIASNSFSKSAASIAADSAGTNCVGASSTFVDSIFGIMSLSSTAAGSAGSAVFGFSVGTAVSATAAAVLETMLPFGAGAGSAGFTSFAASVAGTVVETMFLSSTGAGSAGSAV